jgi:hypothetical protein
MEFTLTTICLDDRWRILEQTLNSFSQKLKTEWHTCYCNIDYISGDPGKTVEVLQKYFPIVHSRINLQPNFCQAIKWLWGREFQGEFFFHMEDDWLLKEVVEVTQLQEAIRANPVASGAFLRHWRGPSRICLAASLVRAGWAGEAAAKIDPTKNPENELRRLYPDRPMIGWPVDKNQKQIITDTGRIWLSKKEFKKKCQTDWTSYSPKKRK